MSTLDKIICLCEVNDKTQKDLTTYLGLDKSTFSSWKSGNLFLITNILIR